jgi:hypothetical protein
LADKVLPLVPYRQFVVSFRRLHGERQTQLANLDAVTDSEVATMVDNVIDGSSNTF